jgi:acid phosphatase (class A)
MPGNAQLVQARAGDYAESRLVCGAHYRSDLEAGHVLATALVDRLMTRPAFRDEFDAAQAELAAAHIAP